MACSNNVVRCALTPKYRDVDLLVDMLTYNMAAPAVLRPHAVDENRKRFTPPVDVFEIDMIDVSVGRVLYVLALRVVSGLPSVDAASPRGSQVIFVIEPAHDQGQPMVSSVV